MTGMHQGNGTLAEAAARALRADIVAGELPAARPLTMEALRARYSVGASPLREALSRLVGEGLVTLEANKGFRVSAFGPEDLADIAFMRAAIESAALRTAILQGDEAWEAGIVGTLHAFARITEGTATDRASLDRWQRAHDDFHRALIAACGSPRALDQQRLLSMQHDRYRRALMGGNLPRALLISEHQALARAALARNAEEAARLLAGHMRLTSDFYADALKGSANDNGEERP